MVLVKSSATKMTTTSSYRTLSLKCWRNAQQRSVYQQRTLNTWRLGKRCIKTGIIHECIGHQEEIGYQRSNHIQITCTSKRKHICNTTRVGRRSCRTFSTYFEIIWRCIDDVVIYFSIPTSNFSTKHRNFQSLLYMLFLCYPQRSRKFLCYITRAQ